MGDVMKFELSPGDRPAILAAFDAEVAGISKPRNWSPIGGALFVLSVGMFFALSILTRRWALPILVRSSIYFALVAGILSGLGLLFFGGGSGQSRARAGALAGLDHLVRRFETARAEENIAAAVRLLWNVYYSRGPWTLTTIDTAAARESLDEAGVLEWLQGVERVLVEAKQAQPVFTILG